MTWSKARVAGFMGLVGIALVLTMALGRAGVDICLDVEGDAPASVGASWPGGGMDFTRADPAYEPNFYTARVTALEPRERQLDLGFQLVCMADLESFAYEDADAWSQVATYFLLHGKERPTTLELSGWNLGPDSYLAFLTDSVSSRVSVRTSGGEAGIFDLASEGRGRVDVPLPSERVYQRFHGQVPRHALDELTLAVKGPAEYVPRRLYLNGVVPRIYYRGDAPEKAPIGLITGGWEAGPEFQIPGAWIPGANPPVTFFLILIVLSAFTTAVMAAWKLFPRLYRFSCTGARLPEQARPLGWKAVLAIWLPVLFTWLVFLFTFYPGTMNADALTQWRQTETFIFEPQHPPFYAWCMWLSRFVWDSPFSTALAQVVLGSVAVAGGACLLWRAGTRWYVVAVLIALAALSPRNLTTVIALIKDAPYGICMLAAAVATAGILLRPTRGNFAFFALLGAALGAATLFRHNGPLMVAATLPLLAVFFYRNWRGVLLCFAVTAVVVIGARTAVLARLPLEPTDAGLHDQFTAHLAILIDRDVPIRDDEYDFLAKVRDLQDRWAYDERRVAATTLPFIGEVYHRAWAKAHLGEYKAVYVGLVTRNLLNALRYFWDRGEYIVVPWRTNTPMEAYFLGIPRNDLGLSNFEIFLGWPERIRSVLAWTESGPLYSIFWRPAIPLYLVLAACVVLCIRSRDPRWLAVYLPFLVNTGIVGLAAVSQASRYQFPLTLASAFLIALAFIPLHASEEGAKRV